MENKIKERFFKFRASTKQFFKNSKVKVWLLVVALIVGIIYFSSREKFVTYLEMSLAMVWINIWALLLITSIVVSGFIYTRHDVFVNEKQWYWRKVSFRILWVVSVLMFAIVVIGGKKINMAPLEKARLKLQYQVRVDSTKDALQYVFESKLSSYKKGDEQALKLSEEKAKELKTELVTLQQSFDSVVTASNFKEASVKQSQSSSSDFFGRFTGRDKMWLSWLLAILATVSLVSLLFKNFTWIPVKFRRNYVGIPALVLAAVVFLWVKFFPDFFVWKHKDKETIAKSEPVKKIETPVPAIVPPPPPADTTTEVVDLEEEKPEVGKTPKGKVKKEVPPKIAPAKKYWIYKPPSGQKKKHWVYVPPPKKC